MPEFVCNVTAFVVPGPAIRFVHIMLSTVVEAARPASSALHILCRSISTSLHVPDGAWHDERHAHPSPWDLTLHCTCHAVLNALLRSPQAGVCYVAGAPTYTYAPPGATSPTINIRVSSHNRGLFCSSRGSRLLCSLISTLVYADAAKAGDSSVTVSMSATALNSSCMQHLQP